MIKPVTKFSSQIIPDKEEKVIKKEEPINEEDIISISF